MRERVGGCVDVVYAGAYRCENEQICWEVHDRVCSRLRGSGRDSREDFALLSLNMSSANICRGHAAVTADVEIDGPTILFSTAVGQDKIGRAPQK